MYDYLIVGAGFAGSVLADRLASQRDQRVLLIDRGPHIFHCNSAAIYDYLSQFTEWRPYQHRVLASVDGQLLPFPINLDTVNALYGLNLTSFEVEKFFESVAEKK